MANNESAPAKPPMTEAQMKLRDEARALAKEQGLDWKALSVDERKELKRTVRDQSRQKQA